MTACFNQYILSLYPTRLELATITQELNARVRPAARDLRQLRRAVPERGALHPVRMSHLHRAGLVSPTDGGPVHAGRAVQSGLDSVAPAHAARRHRHAHSRVSHFGYHAGES